MSNSNGRESQSSSSSRIVGATTLVLLDIEISEGRDVLRRLRSLARSELLPEVARRWFTDAAELAAQAVILAQYELEELRRRHPAEAQAAGRMSAELEAEAWTVAGKRFLDDAGRPTLCECGHYSAVHVDSPRMTCAVIGCECEGFEPLATPLPFPADAAEAES